METFPKKPENPDELIKLLQDLKLSIPDKNLAIHYLTYVGYYRLSGYGLELIKHPKQHRHEQRDKDDYRIGSSFQHIVNFYEFDKELRRLILNAIDEIEVSFRISICDIIGLKRKNPHWYSKKHIGEFIDKHLNSYDKENFEKWELAIYNKIGFIKKKIVISILLKEHQKMQRYS
jgi:abortive infection bacteriophage resistance protein